MPPKNADVVQKLHPIGQPTDGMMVAAVLPLSPGSGMPMVRPPKPDTISGWRTGALVVLAQESAHPRNAVALHDVVGVDHVLDPGNRRHMAAHHDGGARRHASHHPAHLGHLADVHDNRSDPHDVVRMRGELRFERLARGEVQDRGGRADILLDHQDAPRAVEHPQREWPLFARHLIVVQLHRVDLAAAEFVVLRVGAEDGTEEDAGLGTLRVSGH